MSAPATPPGLPFDPRARISYRHFTPVSIRYADLDPVGHVNNIAFNTYIEMGRVSLMASLVERFGAPDMDTVVVRVAVDYLAELGFPGTVEAGARIARLGRTSLTVMTPVFVGDTCHALGECVIVLFDRKLRRAVPATPALRAELERRLAEG